MDSIDAYLEKKRKRTQSMNTSAKKIRKIAEQRSEQKKAALTNSLKKKTPAKVVQLFVIIRNLFSVIIILIKT